MLEYDLCEQEGNSVQDKDDYTLVEEAFASANLAISHISRLLWVQIKDSPQFLDNKRVGVIYHG